MNIVSESEAPTMVMRLDYSDRMIGGFLPVGTGRHRRWSLPRRATGYAPRHAAPEDES